MKETLEQEDKVAIEKLLTLSTASGTDVQTIQRIMNIYIDAHCHVCGHCPSQIRFAMNRIKSWYAIYTSKHGN